MDYAARYAELAVRVGCNLEQGQKLVVFGEPEHAPLIRAVAEAGWRAGAGDVDCFCTRSTQRKKCSTGPHPGSRPPGAAPKAQLLS
jgi:leucyl aminopeptidase (aminopeptidase T)